MLFCSFALMLTMVYSLELDCNYALLDWTDIGETYTCYPVTVTATTRVSVTSINGVHKLSKNNSDVKGLHIFRGECHYLPNNFDQFFENLIGLSIKAVKLKQLSSSDLKPFRELKIILAKSNDLETLDKNLFGYNTKLEFIYFAENKIKTVGLNILEPLTYLTTADFSSNSCINKKAQNKIQLEELKVDLNSKCVSFIVSLELVKEEFQEKLSLLENKLSDSETRYSELKLELENLQVEKPDEVWQSFNQTLSEITLKLEELEIVMSLNKPTKLENSETATHNEIEDLIRVLKTIQEKVDDMDSNFQNTGLNLTEAVEMNAMKIEELQKSIKVFIQNFNKTDFSINETIIKNNENFHQIIAKIEYEMTQQQLKYNDSFDNRINSNMALEKSQKYGNDSASYEAFYVVISSVTLILLITAMLVVTAFCVRKKKTQNVVTMNDYNESNFD